MKYKAPKLKVRPRRSALALFALALCVGAFISTSRAQITTTFYVDADYTGTTRVGSSSQPWHSLSDTNNNVPWSQIDTALGSGPVTVYFSARKDASGGDVDQTSTTRVLLTRGESMTTNVVTLDGNSQYNQQSNQGVGNPNWTSYSGSSRHHITVNDVFSTNNESTSSTQRHYITVQGFSATVTNGKCALIESSDHFTFNNNKCVGQPNMNVGPEIIIGAAYTLIGGVYNINAYPDQITISNNDISAGFGECVYVAGNPDGQDTFNSKNRPTGSNITIQGNVLHDCAQQGGQGDGVDIKDGNSNVQIIGNEIYDSDSYCPSTCPRGIVNTAYTVTGTAPAGSGQLSNVSQDATSGSGLGATFNVSWSGGVYNVTVYSPGGTPCCTSNYANNDTITIYGDHAGIGGMRGTNDITITLPGDGSGISGLDAQGIVLQSASVVDRNFIHRVQRSGITTGTGYVNQYGRSNTSFRNNVIVQPGIMGSGGGIILQNGGAVAPFAWSGPTIQNNTIYAPADENISIVAGTTGAIVQNNIMQQTGSANVMKADNGTLVGYALDSSHSNNAYYRSGAGSVLMNCVSCGGTYTSSTINSWENNSGSANPVFVSTSTPYVASNFSLQGTSPYLGSGAKPGLNLTSSFTVDYTGGNRPSVGNWAMGAFDTTTVGPVLTNISPDNGNDGATVAVTLTGTTLGGSGPSISVSGSGITTNTLSCGSTSCTVNFVIASNAAPTARTVSLTTADGTSNSVTFTVIDATPPVPGNSGTLSASGTSATTASVSWTKGTDNVSAPSALVYKTYRSLSNNIDTVSNMVVNGSLSSTDTDASSVSIAGLTCGTTYYFNVALYDQAGNSAAYTMTNAATGVCPPAPPSQSGTGRHNIRVRTR